MKRCYLIPLIFMYVILFVRPVVALEFLTGRSTAIGGTSLLSDPSSSELVELPVSLIHTG